MHARCDPRTDPRAVLSEAILLALIGGASGVAIGSLATTVYAHTKHWAVVIPTEASCTRHRQKPREAAQRSLALRCSQKMEPQWNHERR
jgi:hypothetical protein